MGVEVCSTCTVGTPYKGKGLSARANRIGKCFSKKRTPKKAKNSKIEHLF